jgi:hypothetical protein
MKDLIETASDILWINEAFDRPYKWKKKSNSSDIVKYTFDTSDKRNFVVTMINEEYLGAWEISFVTSGSFAPTGEGDQFRIFATVIDCIKDFIKNKDPEAFMFFADAKERKGDAPSSRMKLYDRMVKRFANDIKYMVSVEEVDGEKVYQFYKL